MYCRVTLGSENIDCFVKDEFKCIVIVNKNVAYSPEMPIAFLNRFEKQLISYRTSLSSKMEPLISKIEDRLSQMFGVSFKQLTKLFYGFNDDTTPSALFSILAQKKDEQELTDIVGRNQIEELVVDEKMINAVVDLFKPLCNPEIILEIAIDQKGKFDDEKAGQKEFSSFNKVIELQRMESNKQIALILTDNSEFALSDQWGDATKKIESFKKSSDFEQTINHFFSSNNTTQDLLILQYVHDPKRVDHFMHIKYMLEHAHHQYYCCNEEEKKEVEQKLVVLLVHIKPFFKDTFPLIFSRKWKLTYVANLSLIEPIQLKTLCSQTISDVLESNLSDSRLHKAIRQAFEWLQFPVHKNGGGEIQKFFTSFEELVGFEECRKKLKTLAIWTLSLDCPFFERYENVIDRLLTMSCMNILSVFYENCYFQVFFNAVRKHSEYLIRLFVETAKDNSIVTIPRLTDVLHRLVSVKPDLHPVSIQYEAMFPWSHFFHNWCCSKLTSIVAIIERCNENENKCDYKYQHENGNDKKTRIKLENYHKIIQSSTLLGVLIDEGGNALKLLSKCDIEHCRMYLMDIIAAKYNLNQSHKAAVVANIMFFIISMHKWEVSVALIESILYFLSDIFAKYVDQLKCCQNNGGVVLELHTLKMNDNH
ncbi:hypothetical protein RFI_03193 [Reticulomyxa filosa]|uniref:Uncharacterized protein n=1 Tax=Reticulomyxa filosa TaxID=46433 RepID=X6P8E5_RETFI|nr:hypothetical protein RFI_03193 [Reticulomyxa filosa]|eukprot:ETO33902.1 hypothetical protein RFI_03193 [Reticulomyxa filosa]